MSKSKRGQKKFLIVILFLLFFLFSANFAFALEIKYPKIPGVSTPQQFLKEIEEETIEKEKALSLYVKYLFYLFLMIGGLLTLGSTIFGGVKYLISGGNVPAMKDARERISAGILGLILIFTSYILVITVNPELTIFSIGKPKMEEPELVEIPPVESEVPVYIEIPLGRLIEKVKTQSEIVKNEAEDVWYIGAENTEIDHTSVRELADCLKKLSEKCECPKTEDCEPADSTCKKGKCLKDPCDKPISASFCGNDIFLPTNLREAIEEKKVELNLMKEELLKEREELLEASLVLQYEYSRLKLAEALLRDSLLPPTNWATFIGVENKEIKKISPWEDIAIEDDPATFYISEKENEEIIKIVESIAVETFNPPFPEDWEPPPPPPLPEDPEAVILYDVIPLYQGDPRWWDTAMDKCEYYSPPRTLACCGCGPTSLTVILRYFDFDVRPDDIAPKLTAKEYICGQGSSAYGLALWARRNYGLSFEESKIFDFNALQAKIRAGKPIMVRCGNFYGTGSGHISVIRGLEEGYVYFADSGRKEGDLIYSVEQVKTFNCTHFYAFSK